MHDGHPVHDAFNNDEIVTDEEEAHAAVVDQTVEKLDDLRLGQLIER